MSLMVPAAYHDAMSDYTAVVSNPIHIVILFYKMLYLVPFYMKYLYFNNICLLDFLQIIFIFISEYDQIQYHYTNTNWI